MGEELDFLKNASFYRRWLDRHKVDASRIALPDREGLFHLGRLRCVLPYFRACWRANPEAQVSETEGARRVRKPPEPPDWGSKTWKPLKDGNRIIGWSRFLRADQALDWVRFIEGIEESNEEATGQFLERLGKLVRGRWLVPVDDPLRGRLEILDRRVEAMRVAMKNGRLLWSRRVSLFPDIVRRNVTGLDVVHTPESERAGLTRYLCNGWSIDDSGALIEGEGATRWGPSTSRIPFRLHDAPRRLMLGASLQARAVDLEEPKDAPRIQVDEPGWEPPGKNLRAVFSLHDGWTHEDAIVLSQTASKKLRRWEEKELQVAIPAVAAHVELRVAEDDEVKRGDPLARAFIDLYALGWRRHEAERLGAEDGRLEIALPGVVTPFDAKILEIKRSKGRSVLLRETITFILEVRACVNVGDKLSTRHGIKGVVSRILGDEEMPPVADGRAEIVLSPVGIARRGAMGQFLEADDESEEVPHAGTIFVMRQTQDAASPSRFRICGAGAGPVRGQRYGEMEFWALMAHGAPEVARELLSVERSTARWMQWEKRTGERDDREKKIEEGDDQEKKAIEENHRTLATRALNRYLALVEVKIEKGRFVEHPSPQAFEIPTKNLTDFNDAWNLLEDAGRFADRGGLGVINLGGPLEINLEGHTRTIKRLYVLPPWLRPPSEGGAHQLTRAYRRLLISLLFGGNLTEAITECLRLALDEKIGAGRFLRREVLGRRLTRSARAVIIPRPDLRIDQISIPKRVAEVLFEGLSERSQSLVLVNRNPTLHRRGLIALRPVIEETDDAVFGLPLGVLQPLGADFDGDQVSIVAIETDAALNAAERLLPGSMSLRVDKFRRRGPAFPLLHELSAPEEEWKLAADSKMSQEDWSRSYSALIGERLHAINGGWDALAMKKAIAKNEKYWRGLGEEGWFGGPDNEGEAEEQMTKVYKSVRKKGQLGGILRRQLYLRKYPFRPTDDGSNETIRNQIEEANNFFWSTVDALQAVTERLVQSALSVKTGEGVISFDPDKYFKNPKEHAESLSVFNDSEADAALQLDRGLDPEKVSTALGESAQPAGLLRWIAHPRLDLLLDTIENAAQARSSGKAVNDPRISWFLD